MHSNYSRLVAWTNSKSFSTSTKRRWGEEAAGQQWRGKEELRGSWIELFSLFVSPFQTTWCYSREQPLSFKCRLIHEHTYSYLTKKQRKIPLRALPFHQCGPGSIPGFDDICTLSSSVLYSAPRGFSSAGTPIFPSPQKPTFDLTCSDFS